jgi:hypothetical protein
MLVDPSRAVADSVANRSRISQDRFVSNITI